jgi:acyl transferase domain-containing protein
MMDPALAQMRAAAQRITFNPAQTPLLSSVTGEWTPTFDATYLAEHARHPVRFGPAVQRLLDDGYDTFVEVGPGSTLTGLVTSIAKGGDRSGPLSVFPVLNGAAEAGSALVGTVGRLWTAGVSLSRPDSSLSRPRVDVPTYPFQRTRHWLPQVQTLSSAPQSSTSGSDADPVSSLLHRFGWEELPLPAGSVLQSVCITGGDDDLAGVLADRLARRAVTVHVAALEELRDSPPASVLVLLAGRAVDIDGAASLDRSAGEATAAMLQVCRHLHERTTPLIVVTEDVAVTGTVSERARPAQAIAAGLAMALPEENPQQPVRVVDLSSLDDASDRLDAVIRELDAPPRPRMRRWSPWRRGRRLTKAAVRGEVLRRERPAPLPADGRYLITGGAGGVGAAVAGFLARRGHPEIFLVGGRPSVSRPSARASGAGRDPAIRSGGSLRRGRR